MGASVCKVNRLRLLSLAMALVMLISCFPVLAFSEEDSWETEAEYDDSSYWDSTEGDEEEYTEEYDPWEETEKEEETDYWHYGADSHFFPDYQPDQGG